MLNTKILIDNNFITENKEKTVVIKLSGLKKEFNPKDKPQVKKNIALVIDVSGSMDESLNKEHYFGLYHKLSKNQNISNRHITKKSKLDLAKEAAISFVNSLEEGDVCSIVEFANDARVVVDATEIDTQSKKNICSKITSLKTLGSTNLHAGWFNAVKCVAQNVNEKSLNKIILLTDGQVNLGVTDASVFAKDISAVYAQSIQTSTIGFGEDFNEDFLMTLSNAGGANSYYADKTESLKNILMYELSGMSNIAAQNIKIEFSNFEVENFNGFVQEGNTVLINEIFGSQEISLVCRLKGKEQINKVAQLQVKISFEDEKNYTVSEVFDFEYLTGAEYEKVPSNKEVAVETVLINIAQSKMKIKEYIDNNDIKSVTMCLDQSSALANAYSYDFRVQKELASLSNQKTMAVSGQTKSLRKTALYESYSTMRGIDTSE